MKKLLPVLLLIVAGAVMLPLLGCQLLMPTFTVSGSVYTNNYSSATSGQLWETTDIYPVVIASSDEADLGGTDFSAMDLSALLQHKETVGDAYNSPFWMTQFDNADYGPITVTIADSDWFRVLFVQDTNDDGSITADDNIVGGSSIDLNIYSSGEEVLTESVDFYWNLVKDMP